MTPRLLTSDVQHKVLGFEIMDVLFTEVVNCFLILTGYFLSTLLGPVNVRAPRNDVRLKVKEEYNSYRVRS